MIGFGLSLRPGFKATATLYKVSPKDQLFSQLQLCSVSVKHFLRITVKYHRYEIITFVEIKVLKRNFKFFEYYKF